MSSISEAARPRVAGSPSPLCNASSRFVTPIYIYILQIDRYKYDADQNGMLSLNELLHFRGGAPPGGGLTLAFVQRVFQVRYTNIYI